MIARLALLTLAAALPLAGCNTTGTKPATVSGGCGMFRPLPGPIKADTRTGQVWVDGTAEVLVRQCGFPRPSAP